MTKCFCAVFSNAQKCYLPVSGQCSLFIFLEKYQKSRDFLMLSGGMEMEQFYEMS